MSAFNKLFAVEPKEIKKDVIITPFLNLEYFKSSQSGRVNKGFIFSVLTENKFSVIKTGIGSSFIGDAVVYLKDTPCRRIYFVGSCGIISNFKIGDLAVVDRALAWESFSQVLGDSCPRFFINAKNELSRAFIESNKEVRGASLATLGSLSLQEKISKSLKKQKIDLVDMEVSAFVSATKYFKIPSLALLYATDIISTKPFFRKLDDEDRGIIKSARQKAISLICDYIQSINA
jgi:purine-nucleoside phosphorylase